MSSSWTESDLTALETAIKSNVTEVSYSDKRVKYRSLDEMLKLRAVMRRALSKASTITRIRTNFSKGLDSSNWDITDD